MQLRFFYESQKLYFCGFYEGHDTKSKSLPKGGKKNCLSLLKVVAVLIYSDGKTRSSLIMLLA